MNQFAVSIAEKFGVFAEWLFNPISQLIFWPLLGCLLICLLPPNRLRAIRTLAVIFSGLSLVSAILMLTGAPAALLETPMFAQYVPFRVAPEVGMQFGLSQEQYRWLTIQLGETQSFSVGYNVGIDGLSMPLVMLTCVMLLLSVLWSLRRTERLRDYFALVLLLQSALLGIFCALDYVLFYLFWELMLIPMYFLISGWGKDREKAPRAAMKFFLYTLTGSVFYLVAFIALQVLNPIYSFSIMEIMNSALVGNMDYVAPIAKLLIFAGLFIGFAVKVPLFPFHTWLPDAHTEAPTEMSVILAAIMLKTGAYAMLRILYPTLPGEAYQFGPVIAFCAVAAIVYGAALTLVQTDFKRMVAYSSISHMGFIVLGISAMNMDATIGAIFHMVAHGIIIAALFFLSGVIEERYGTRDLRQLSGMWKSMPSYSLVLTIAAFAAMGFPLLAGFWGEFMVIKGTFFNSPKWQSVHVLWTNGSTYLQWLAVIAVLGVLVAAVYMINLLARVLPGEPAGGSLAFAGAPLRRFRRNEALAMTLLPASMFVLFFRPEIITNSCTLYAVALWQTYLVK